MTAVPITSTSWACIEATAARAVGLKSHVLDAGVDVVVCGTGANDESGARGPFCGHVPRATRIRGVTRGGTRLARVGRRAAHVRRLHAERRRHAEAVRTVDRSAAWQ